MFDLYKSFSQLCLAIFGEKIYFFFSVSTLKWFDNAKNEAQNLSHFFCCAKSNLILSMKEQKFKINFFAFFLTGKILTPLIGILKMNF